jgi:hypothetical protein
LDSVRARETLEDDRADENEAAPELARQQLHKYLKERAQIEYKEKLAKLRELKQQTKAQQARQQQRARKTLRDFQ